MKIDEVLERATRMLQSPVLYWIGKGGHFGAEDTAAPPSELIHVPTELGRLPPDKRADYLAKAQAAGITEIPTGLVPACDCSNFSNWVLRIPRGSRSWMNTDAMHRDALGARRVFEAIDAPRPGALLVYPKPGDENFGHVGIVTSIDAGRIEVVHCSAENFLRSRNGIAATGTDVFDRQPRTIAIWCRHVER